jgi:hypothetical protein
MLAEIAQAVSWRGTCYIIATALLCCHQPKMMVVMNKVYTE